MKSSYWKSISLVVLLIVVTGTLFPILRFSYVDYDDPAFIVGNPLVNRGVTLEGVQWAFTHQNGDNSLRAGTDNLWLPLTWISHMVDIELWKRSWGKHHLGNLVLHLISTVLVFLLALKLKIKLPGTILATALFSLHPLGAETVSWLSDRKGTLSTAFALASLLTYQTRKTRWLSLVLFLGAVLSKPGVVILPGLIILTNYYRTEKPVNLKWFFSQIRRTLAWWALALGVAVLTVYLQSQGTHGSNNMPIGETLMRMPAQWSFYSFRALIPINYSFHYTIFAPFDQAWFSGLSLIVFLGLGIAAWASRKVSRIGILALGWAFLCWLPVSGLVYVGTSFTADRYAYLALIGPFLALGSFFGNWAIKHQRSAHAILLITISFLALLMSGEIRKWRNTESLYSSAVEAQPKDWVGNLNYGVFLLRDKQIPEALAQLKKTALIAPLDPSVQYHLGLAAARSGEIDTAMDAYQNSLKLDPSSTQSWISYGHLLEYNKPAMVPEIEKAYLKAIELSQSRSPSPLLLLSRFYMTKNQPELARRYFEKLKPLTLTNPEHQKLFQELDRALSR